MAFNEMRFEYTRLIDKALQLYSEDELWKSS